MAQTKKKTTKRNISTFIFLNKRTEKFSNNNIKISNHKIRIVYVYIFEVRVGVRIYYDYANFSGVKSLSTLIGFNQPFSTQPHTYTDALTIN